MPDGPVIDPDATPLSPAGRARRDAMLETLTKRMTRVHRHRRAGRGALGVAGLAAVAAGALLLARPGLVPERAPVLASEDPTPVERSIVESPRADIRVVHTDATILTRYAVAPASTAVTLDDDGLLDALVALDRPVGLIRRGGRVRLTADVADPGP